MKKTNIRFDSEKEAKESWDKYFKLENELKKSNKKYLDGVGLYVKICNAFLISVMICAIIYLIISSFFNL